MTSDFHPRRRSLRLPAYDYSRTGAYFITVCTRDRVMLFGDVIDGHVQLNGIGMIVQQTWDDLSTHYAGIDLDAFIVMPNHVHGMIILADEPETRRAIPEIARGFKTFSARRVHEHAGKRGILWQRGYYEHVIRNEIRTISGEQRLPEEGGFETRPYKSRNLRVAENSQASGLRRSRSSRLPSRG